MPSSKEWQILQKIGRLEQDETPETLSRVTKLSGEDAQSRVASTPLLKGPPFWPPVRTACFLQKTSLGVHRVAWRKKHVELSRGMMMKEGLHEWLSVVSVNHWFPWRMKVKGKKLTWAGENTSSWLQKDKAPKFRSHWHPHSRPL